MHLAYQFHDGHQQVLRQQQQQYHKPQLIMRTPEDMPQQYNRSASRANKTGVQSYLPTAPVPVPTQQYVAQVPPQSQLSEAELMQRMASVADPVVVATPGLIPLPANEPLPRIDKIMPAQWNWQTLQRCLNVPSLVRIDMNSEEQWNWDVLKAILQTIVNPSKDLVFSVVVSYMNRFFGLLVGNDTTRDSQFVKKWYDRTHKRNVIVSLNERKLGVHTENKMVMYFDERRQQKYMSVMDIWRKHSDRAEYSSIVYNPRPAGHRNAAKIDEINTYTGLRWSDAECKAAYEDPVNRENMQFYLQHGQRIICNGNTDYWTYLHKWMADAVQFPHKKSETAILIQGNQGSGKTKWIRPYIKIFGSSGKLLKH